jgi:hypothetical protein
MSSVTSTVPPGFYSILGVSTDASHAEIRRAYRAAARRYHPDSGWPGASSLFAEVQEAYRAIMAAGPAARTPGAAPPPAPAAAEVTAVLPVSPPGSRHSLLAAYRTAEPYRPRFVDVLV